MKHRPSVTTRPRTRPMIETEFEQDGDVLSPEFVADALVVGGNLRYATLSGESETIENGVISKVRSEVPLKVTIKLSATGEKVKRYGCTVANYVADESMTYLAMANSTYEAHVGEIVRVRRQDLT